MKATGAFTNSKSITQNFIQINGLVLNENSIRQLPEVRKIIELEDLGVKKAKPLQNRGLLSQLSIWFEGRLNLSL
jgi:hypothetical protein